MTSVCYATLKDCLTTDYEDELTKLANWIIYKLKLKLVLFTKVLPSSHLYWHRQRL